MWNPCLTNDYQPILAAFMGRQGRTFAFLEGAKLGKSATYVPILQEKTALSLSRGLLVPWGRAPRTHTVELSRSNPFRG